MFKYAALALALALSTACSVNVVVAPYSTFAVESDVGHSSEQTESK